MVEDDEVSPKHMCRILWIKCKKDEAKDLVESLISESYGIRELENPLLSHILFKIETRDPRIPWIATFLLEIPLSNDKDILIIKGKDKLSDSSFLVNRKELNALISTLHTLLKREEFEKVCAIYPIWNDTRAVVLNVGGDDRLDKLVSAILLFIRTNRMDEELIEGILSKAIDIKERRELSWVLQILLGVDLGDRDIAIVRDTKSRRLKGLFVDRHLIDYFLEDLEKAVGKDKMEEVCEVFYFFVFEKRC